MLLDLADSWQIDGCRVGREDGRTGENLLATDILAAMGDVVVDDKLCRVSTKPLNSIPSRAAYQKDTSEG